MRQIREQGQHCVWNACDVPLPFHSPCTKCNCSTKCCCVSTHEKCGWTLHTSILKVQSNFLCILARHTNITKIVPPNFPVQLNECKIKISRACVHARTLQNSDFCFHNLHSFRCNTLGHNEIQAIYLHSFRKAWEKSKKSRKMG